MAAWMLPPGEIATGSASTPGDAKARTISARRQQLQDVINSSLGQEISPTAYASGRLDTQRNISIAASSLPLLWDMRDVRSWLLAGPATVQDGVAGRGLHADAQSYRGAVANAEPVAASSASSSHYQRSGGKPMSAYHVSCRAAELSANARLNRMQAVDLSRPN
jgi:hypothetical protein